MDSPSATPVTVPALDVGDVRLRPFRHDDAAWVYYVSLDAELRRRLSLPDPYLHAHARYFVDEVAIASARAGNGADFVIEDTATGIGLGWVGFHRRYGDEFSCGFWLAADVRGRGIMTRAVRAACRWALAPRPDGLGADPLHWEAQVGNHASRAVAEHVGFAIQAGTVTGRHGHQKWTGKLGARAVS
jgi:RimJ/RimL family protein N-acetyltransferase